MSQFEWLLTVAAYLLVAGIVFSTVLFVVYQRKRPASKGEGENTGDLANMMILLQTMRDMLEEQKTLARQFNQNFEQKLAHMEEKNRAAHQRAEELEHRAVKLEGRLQRVREELAVLQGEIEAASHGVAQERAPGPLKFSQASGAGSGAPSTPEARPASDPTAGSQADPSASPLGAPASRETDGCASHTSEDPQEERAGEHPPGPDERPQASDMRTPEEREEFGAQAPVHDRNHERYADASAPSPDESPEITESSQKEPPPSAHPDTPGREGMPWEWREAKAEPTMNTKDDEETSVKSADTPADSSGDEDSTESHEERADELAQRERPALHILASPAEDGENDDEPEKADAPNYWVGLGFAGQSPESAYATDAGQEHGQKVPEPSDPEAARQAFRALLNMGQESQAETVSRTETLDQPAASEAEEGPLRSRVYEYSDAGMSIAEIASELGIGKGEVRLILSLREQGGR